MITPSVPIATARGVSSVAVPAELAVASPSPLNVGSSVPAVVKRAMAKSALLGLKMLPFASATPTITGRSAASTAMPVTRSLPALAVAAVKSVLTQPSPPPNVASSCPVEVNRITSASLSPAMSMRPPTRKRPCESRAR